MGGDLSTELALPRDFEAVAELVREEDLEGLLVFGDDPGAWREKIDGVRATRASRTSALHDVGRRASATFIEFARQLT